MRRGTRGLSRTRCAVEPLERRALLSAATHAAFTVQPASTAAAGAALRLTVALEDGSGRIDTTQSSTVTVSVASGPSGATLIGTASAVAVAGVATINAAALTKVGTYTLRATATGLTAATSTAIAVTPAQAAALSVVGPASSPASVAAGATLGPITATIEDAFGNVVTSATSAVYVVPNVYSGAIDQDSDYLGGTTAEPVVNGQATFADLTLPHAGETYLTFSYGDLRQVNLNTPTVTAGPVAALAFAAVPASIPAGQALQPEVDVVDAFGNVVPTAATAVTLTTPVGTRAATATAGVASFGAVALTTAGTYTLSAVAASLPAVTSTPFDVTSLDDVAQFQFLTQPTTVTAGQAMAGVLVQLDDAYGNAVHAHDGTTITIAVTKGGVLYSTEQAPVANGQATLLSGTVLTAAGTYAVTVGSASSKAFAVLPAAASALTATPASAVVLAGQPVSPITVGVTDAYGNPVADGGYTITANASGQTLGGTTTLATAGGTAGFGDLTFPSAGTYALTFSGGTLARATVTVYVTSPLLAAASVAAGQSAGTVAVNVAQSFPNWTVPAKGATVSVTVTAPAGSGATLRTLTARVAQGRATVRLPKLTVAGTYTVSVRAADGESVQQALNVAAGAPAKLTFSKQPTVTGGVLAAAVAVIDKYGNGVALADGQVVALRSNPKTTVATATVTGGVATFAGDDVLGMFPGARARLTAACGKLRPAVSSPFAVG